MLRRRYFPIGLPSTSIVNFYNFETAIVDRLSTLSVLNFEGNSVHSDYFEFSNFIS